MRKQWGYALLSFGLPVCLLMMVYAVWGQYPFGDNSLLVWDMNWQYAPFFSHLHDILHGDASALYTFSRAVGGNMLSVAAYYLMSPFHLLFYFFDAEQIYIGILIVTLLKTGAGGTTMYFFLKRRGHRSAALLFSCAYAVSAYVTGYQFNLFWMDALILLPFTVGEIENLIDKGTWLRYALAIGLSVITNFYMGYMICGFSVLYFLCYFFFISREKKCVTVLCYAGSSLLGGMLSMWILLPVWYVLQKGKGGFSLSILKNFQKMFEYSDFFTLGFCGTVSREQITGGKPLIYCGVFAVLMAVYWVVRGKDTLREKTGYLLLLFILGLSLNRYNLNCIWHGFQYPMGSPYRFSFVYVFLMLYLAYKGTVCLLEEHSFLPVNRAVVGTGLALLAGLFVVKEKFLAEERGGFFVLNLFLVAAYTVLVLFIRKWRAAGVTVMALTCLELFLNAQCFYASGDNYNPVKVSEYRQYMERVMPLVERVREDGALFRTVLADDAYRTPNDPFLFNLYGLDSYTSVEEAKALRIGSNLGYSASIVWGMHYGNGASRAGEAFLGVKYVISSEDPGSGYVRIEENDGLALYENRNALPFAVLAESTISDLKEDDPVFRYINGLYRSVDSQAKDRKTDPDIFRELPGELVRASHCGQSEDGSWCTDGAGKDSYLEYEYTADQNGVVYVWYDAAGVSKAEVCDRSEETGLSDQRSVMKCLGNRREGEKIRIRFCLRDDEPLFPERIYVSGESGETLAAFCSRIKEQQMQVTMHSDSGLDFLCRNESRDMKYLLCSIPWEKGWQVSVDGEPLKETLDMQNFIAVPVGPGEHRIEMKFVPQGLYAGTGVTALACVILILLGMKRKKKPDFAK